MRGSRPIGWEPLLVTSFARSGRLTFEQLDRSSTTVDTVCRYATAAVFCRRYAVPCMSARDERKHHVARGQESNHHRRHARYRLCDRLPFYRGRRCRHRLWLAPGDCDAAVEKLAAAYPDAEVWGRSCDLTSLEAVTELLPRLQPTWAAWTRSSTMPESPSAHPFWTIQPRSSPKLWTSTSSPSLTVTRLPPRS